MIKSLGRHLCSGLLKFTLYFAAISAALVAVLASPTDLKQSLAASNFYDGLIENALGSEDVQKASENSSIANEALSRAAKQALTPQVVRSSTEQAIDGIYNWLNTDLVEPDFNIDLSSTKEAFILAAGSEVENHVASLPLCSSAQLRTISSDTDPLELTCRPPTLTAASAKEKAISELRNSEDFFQDPVITADTFKSKDSDKSAFEQASGIKSFYGATKALRWVLLLLSGLLALGVVFLSHTRLKGLKSVSISLLGTGLFLLITSRVAVYLFNRSTSGAAENTYRESVLQFLKAINDQFSSSLFVYSLVYVGLGAAILLILHFTKSKFSLPDDKPAAPKPTK